MNEREWMLTAILDCRRVDLALEAPALTERQQSLYDRMRLRRAHGEPLQYIIGRCDFMGLSLSVDPRVLIPRPETELLAELAVRMAKGIQAGEKVRILDLGTGSGNIAIALAKNIGRSTVVALDIDAGALSVASQNARANNVEDKIEFCQKDLAGYLQAARDCGDKYHMIVSNPPYIPTAQLTELPADVSREPRLALDGGEDGLNFYREIIPRAAQILTPGGFLILEIGDAQRATLEAIFRQYPCYNRVRFYRDYVGTDRMVSAQTAPRPHNIENEIKEECVWKN